MNDDELLQRIDRFYRADADERSDDYSEEQARSALETFLDRLESGDIRAALPPDDDRHDGPDDADDWQVVPSVKRGILLGFSIGENRVWNDELFRFADRETYPPQKLPMGERNIRVVPGGSAVRRGAHVDADVTVMPPAYVNVGAWVGPRTMVDSHALVGSCAQIGADVHLSAGAQIGGVLEPVGQRPVVVEDGALVGGNTGVYEGVRVGEGAVLAAGSIVTASTPIYDLVHEEVLGDDDGPPTVPPRAVVVPGSRPASGEFAREHDLQLDALVVVKYRDESTDAQTALEEALR